MKHRIFDRLYQVMSNLFLALVPILIYELLRALGIRMAVIIPCIIILSLALAVLAAWNFNRVTDMTNFMNNFHIARLLQGRSMLHSSDSSNQIFDIGLECKCYVVVLVQHLTEQKEINVPKRMTGAPRNRVSECVTEALHGAFYPHFTVINQSEVALIGIPGLQQAENSAPVYRSLNQLIACLQSAHAALVSEGQDLRIAVSSVRDSLQDAGNAYQETLEMMEYSIFCENDTPVLSTDQSATLEANLTHLQETAALERKFFLAATNYQFSAASDYMLEMLEHYSRHRYESVHTIKARFYGRIETVYNLVELKLKPGEDRSSFRQEFYDEFMALTTKEQISGAIRHFFAVLEQNFNAPAAESSIDYAAEAAAYIERNYGDPELSVAAIAEAVGVNVSYLSRVFKQKKEYGVLEYIHQYRIEQVKRLLISTQLDFQEVALQTGYENAKALGRVFKKYTGITLSAFREAHGGVLASEL